VAAAAYLDPAPRGSPGSIVLAQVKLVSGRDEEALERLLATLSVSPP
jgi:thioredoxin-like negative regulator of GroEL